MNMASKNKFKCGFVSIVGRPNVGKSTLLNSLIATKLAITSNVQGTTRNLIDGIYNDADSQIIFVDTPGIAKPLNKLGNITNGKAYSSTTNVDLILFVTDASKKINNGDKFILNRLPDDIPVFLIINKIDIISKDDLLTLITNLKDLYPFKEIIPISALTKNNLLELIKTIKEYLPTTDKIYSEDELTNVSTKFIMAEFVREKVLQLTHSEVPHSVTCYVESYDEEEDIVNIKVLIAVDRDNLKKIIIGKNGSMLKEVGTRARMDMEKFLGKKVFLETYVKTLADWRDQERYLKDLGFEDEN